mmetsp:Transcript_25617/g.38273  ORF Transcript_25617/g.38273 Transcript_25617/m.38273 type:complete len:187 (-) Transcript_25617:27-587(-)|eukprot:CAMPEP_0116030792 /NCGR_PEP_ID=MMETSP0321-20121206/17086_1 /TAXON_ID=163516 /ORGANISM="Leptocylindrus danicus var. danicus, Strain B650" /LENGTH=186 /DNA_ID=CAMNT_0003505707 /DNA_START=77 /DNA_END=640 /DNA_ORIENTATION=+
MFSFPFRNHRQATRTTENNNNNTTSSNNASAAAAAGEVEDVELVPISGEQGNGDDGDGNYYSDDDSTETVIEENYARRVIDQGGEFLWNEDDEAHEQRRREIIRAELERVQRSNFMHFMVLLLVPTCLLMVIFINVLTENADCDGASPHCENEPRSFINAFTTRCVCSAVKPEVIQDDANGGDGEL